MNTKDFEQTYLNMIKVDELSNYIVYEGMIDRINDEQVKTAIQNILIQNYENIILTNTYTFNIDQYSGNVYQFSSSQNSNLMYLYIYLGTFKFNQETYVLFISKDVSQDNIYFDYLDIQTFKEHWLFDTKKVKLIDQITIPKLKTIK